MIQFRRAFTCLSIVVLAFVAFVFPAAGQGGDIIPADTLARPDKAVFIEQTCTTDTPVENTFVDFFTTPHQGYTWVQDVERQLGYIKRVFRLRDSEGGAWIDLMGVIPGTTALMTRALNADGSIPCEGDTGYAAARWDLIDSLARSQAALANVGNYYNDPLGQGDAVVGRLVDKLATSHYAALLHAHAVANVNSFGVQRVAASMSATAAQEPSRAAEPPEPPISYDEFVAATCSPAFTPLFNPASPSPDQPYALIDDWYNTHFNRANGGIAAQIEAAYIALYEYLRREDATGFRDFELSMSASAVSNALGSQLVYGASDSVYRTSDSRRDASAFVTRYQEVCDDIAAYRWGVMYDMGGYAPEPPQQYYQLLGITPAWLAMNNFLTSAERSAEAWALADVALDALDHAAHLAEEGIAMTAAALRGEDVAAFIARYPAYETRISFVETGPDAGTLFQSRITGGMTGVIAGDTNANVRAAAGTGFDIVTTVAPGTSVTVMGRNSDSTWLNIEYNGRRGWIASFLIRLNGRIDNLSVTG